MTSSRFHVHTARYYSQGYRSGGLRIDFLVDGLTVSQRALNENVNCNLYRYHRLDWLSIRDTTVKGNYTAVAVHISMSRNFTTLFVPVNQMSACCLGTALSDEFGKAVFRNYTLAVCNKRNLQLGGDLKTGQFGTNVSLSQNFKSANSGYSTSRKLSN